MKLKKIRLNNIRSYKNQEVTFPEGSILLSGDIGSGKTSVLLGIEFALFGLQPGQRGNSLLRNGEDEGGVEMEMDIDNQSVIVERTLKRGKTVSQDYCAITVDGEKQELSVTELKDKVLDILNYPKEFSKKQNILYKFTVYTPQEGMKQIILENPEIRVNTLRHIFGIDKYKRIIENASILSSKLREERRLKEGMIDSLEEDKNSLTSKEEDLETKQYNLASIEKELFSKTESRKKIQEEKEEISKKMEERRSLKQEIEKTKIMISNKKESLSENRKTMEHLESQIKELSDIDFDEKKIEKLEGDISSNKKDKELLNDENLKITFEIDSLNSKNNENENLRKKITEIDICPTCLQNVDPTYRSNVVNKVDSDISSNKNKMNELKERKEIILRKISNIEEQIKSKEKELQELTILKFKVQNVEERKKRVEEIKKTNESIESDVSILNQHMESLNKSVFDLNKYENIFESKQQELEDAMKDERMAEIKVAELRKEIEVFSRQIEELKERINKTEEIKEKVNYLIKLETWITKSFVPMVSLTEKNVMLRLKKEFSELFSTWFPMLVPDNFDVSLDDNFTPVMSYQDYDIGYSDLSGGERTAIALAYRLALNQVVNSLLGKIKTRDIVILDEPTDGFSDMQIDKMRDVFRQLDVAQLIIVSHEQKIESFVENVIRFKKEHGVSEVESQDFIS
ncbi:MAG: AAA family ATPase [Candidatus Pacearchaeota archaeon]